MEIIELDKKNEKLWNNYIINNKNSSFFHTLEWRNIIKEVYNFKPLYYIAINNKKPVGIVNTFLTKSIIFGKKIISSPFNFYCDPLSDNIEITKLLINRLIEQGKKERIKYIQLKPIYPLNNELVSELNLLKNEHYLISTLKLEKDLKETIAKYDKRLTKNLRTLKRNAEKKKLKIKWTREIEDLKDFYQIMIKIYRDKHHMICQPFKLFKEIINHYDNSILLVAKINKKIIAGTFLIKYKNEVIYAYGASNEDYKGLSPNTLLVDHFINFFSSRDIQNIDFGITSPYQEGLLKFKQQWGTTETIIPFYYIPINIRNIKQPDYYKSYSYIRKSFKYLPIPIIKMVSPIITKQLG